MSRPSYAQVRSLYERVITLPEAEQVACLQAAEPALAQEVRALLALRTSTLNESPDLQSRIGATAHAWVHSARHFPERIGPYRVLRWLGEGGMGVVLLAERDDGEFKLQVAIKLIARHAPSALRERLRIERQVLANLAHPNIAALLDGGSTAEGDPYLVMEYVEGISLQEWLATEPELSVRLALLLQITDALEHAHQRLIVHRDLKPSNVLVKPDGRAVLLDFGISKLLARTDQPELTAAGLMTPAYAAPEQLQGESITTATDVHGLGLLLYYLLSGLVPKREHAARTLISASSLAAQSPEPWLRAQAGRLDKELDQIARTATKSDPAERYPTAALFGADLRAYLAGQPVRAVGLNWRYRARKFVLRNRVSVAAVLLGLIVLAGAGVRILVDQQRALLAEAKALREAETAAETTRFLVALFGELDPNLHPGRALSGMELLDLGMAKLDALPDRGVRAQLQSALGAIYQNIGRYQPALSLLTKSRAAQLASATPNTLRLQQTEMSLAKALHSATRDQEALAMINQAIHRSDDSARDQSVANLHAHLRMQRGVILQSLGQFDAANSDYAFAERGFTAAGDQSALASVLHNRGWLAEDQAKFAEALAFTEQALAIKSKTLGPHHPSTINSMHGKAKALRGLNRFAEALPLLQDVLAQRLKVNGELSKPVQQAYDELASIKQDLGCFEQAAAGYQKSLDLARRLAGGNDSLDTAIAINNFATLLQDQGKLELAEAQFRESLKQRRSLLGTKHPAVARASFNLARVLLDQGKHAQALPLVEESLAIRTELLPPLHPDRLASLLLQARLQLISGELSQGEASWQSVQTLMRSAPQPQWPISLQVMLLRTQALRAELHRDKAAQITALKAALTTLQTNQASPAKLAAAQKELQQAEGVAVEPDKGVTTSVAKVCSP